MKAGLSIAKLVIDLVRHSRESGAFNSEAGHPF
jgi:hypothetical protein